MPYVILLQGLNGTNKTRGSVTHCGLAIYMNKDLKAKEELWQFKYFTMLCCCVPPPQKNLHSFCKAPFYLCILLLEKKIKHFFSFFSLSFKKKISFFSPFFLVFWRIQFFFLLYFLFFWMDQNFRVDKEVLILFFHFCSKFVFWTTFWYTYNKTYKKY
jgi:hypothetical protein